MESVKNELLKEENFETSSITRKLKLKATDEKYRMTDIWKDNGIESDIEYAILTNDIYKEGSEMTAKEHKRFKGLRKEPLSGNMLDIEIVLTDLGEIAAQKTVKEYSQQGLEQNRMIA